MIWWPLDVAETTVLGDVVAECACRNCEVRWVDHVGRARCWLCGRPPEQVRALPQQPLQQPPLLGARIHARA